MSGDMGGELFFVHSARDMIMCVENIVGGDRRLLHSAVEPSRPLLWETSFNVTWEVLDGADGDAGKLLKAPIFHDKNRQHYANFPIPEPYFCDIQRNYIVSA